MDAVAADVLENIAWDKIIACAEISPMQDITIHMPAFLEESTV
jgi:hypothetical protein